MRGQSVERKRDVVDDDAVTGAVDASAARVLAGETDDPVTTALPTSSGFPTSPIMGLDLLPDAGTRSADRLDSARAHEATAEVLADRGDWRSAYHHLRAAMTLVQVERSQPVHVPDQLRNEVTRLRRERAEVLEQSRRDSLTASWNRRYLDERLTTLREGDHTSVCVALADIDHFKLVNDTYGHAVGDRVLRCIVGLMSTGLPEEGFCARYGGEEFALVLPGVGLEEAVRVCEAARARVDQHAWDEIAPGLHVTTSVGISCLPARRRAAGPTTGGAAVERTRGPIDDVLDVTDALLYVAKRAGRNAVAYREGPGGRVRLAGAASGRRGLGDAARALFPAP